MFGKWRFFSKDVLNGNIYLIKHFDYIPTPDEATLEDILEFYRRPDWVLRPKKVNIRLYIVSLKYPWNVRLCNLYRAVRWIMYARWKTRVGPFIFKIKRFPYKK